MSESAEQVGTFPVLKVEDLHKIYPGGTHVVKEVSSTTNEGECLGVVGESGSGKSTFTKCLLTPEPASANRATLEGEPLLQCRGEGLHDIRRHLQMVFQNLASSFNLRLTIYDSFLGPLRTRGFVSPSFVQPGTQRKVAEQLVDPVRLPVSCLDRKLHELNGGEKQRATITQAISVEPTPLISDEPTANLDISIQARVSNLLQELEKELGLSSMFISHDLSAAQLMSERSIVLHGGEVIDQFGHDEPFEDSCDQYIRDLIKPFEGWN